MSSPNYPSYAAMVVRLDPPIAGADSGTPGPRDTQRAARSQQDRRPVNSVPERSFERQGRPFKNSHLTASRRDAFSDEPGLWRGC